MIFEPVDSEMDQKMRDGLKHWADKGSLPPGKSMKLADSVRKLATKEKKRYWQRTVGSIAAAVALLITLFVTSPVIRSWAVENLPVVGQYINKGSGIEKGWRWAEEHDMFQEVLAAKTDKGYTFQVHRLLADTTQTTIIYTVEGENPCNISIDYRKNKILFNGKPFDCSYGARSDMVDGVLVGSMELNKSLPQKSGTMEIVVRQIGDVKGEWDVSFPVTKATLSDLTRSIPVNENLEMPNGVLIVESLVLAPTQTVVKLRYQGEPPSPEPKYDVVKLQTPNGLVESRGGHSHGHRINGLWEQTYNLEFQPFEEIPANVTLELAGLVYRKGETHVPLNGKRTTVAPNGREVFIDTLENKGRKGKVTIHYTRDKNNPWPFDIERWQVLDNTGELHPTNPTNITNKINSKATISGNSSNQKSFDLEWKLPFGRKATALINPGYWKFEEDLVTVTIQIPKL